MMIRFILYCILVGAITLKKIYCSKIIRIHEEKDAYYISRYGFYKKIPDNFTLNFFGYNYTDLKIVSKSALVDLVEKEPIKSVLPYNHGTCDDFDSESVEKFQLLQDDDELLNNVQNLVSFVNPSLCFIRNQYFISGRKQDYSPVIYFQLVNKDRLTNLYSLNTLDKQFGIGPGVTSLSPIVQGEDPRTMIIDQNTLAIVTNKKLNPARTILTYVHINHDTHVLELLNETILQPPIPNNHDEKNWTPFIYRSQIHFAISHDETFIVIKQSNMQQPNQTELVTSTPIGHITWNYGTMRGGTPARLLGKNRYLGFFHSMRTNENCVNWREYYFGAYLFESDMPFSVTAISKTPIYHPGWYTGPWEQKWGITYVYFPVDFFYVDTITGEPLHDITVEDCSTECMSRYNITLTFGFQDREGYTANINVLQLFHTLSHYHHNE